MSTTEGIMACIFISVATLLLIVSFTMWHEQNEIRQPWGNHEYHCGFATH